MTASPVVDIAREPTARARLVWRAAHRVPSLKHLSGPTILVLIVLVADVDVAEKNAAEEHLVRITERHRLRFRAGDILPMTKGARRFHLCSSAACPGNLHCVLSCIYGR